MSRKIKFRVWNKVSKEMTFFDKPYFTCLKEPVVGFENCQWKRIMIGGYTEAMQFTGLKDKNGREIYEGDIIRTIGSWWVVKYYQTDCAFRLCSVGHGGSSGLVDLKDTYDVVGNIHENTELLYGNR